MKSKDDKETGLVRSQDAVAQFSFNVDEQLQFANTLVKSGITPYKTGEQALVAIRYGQELGMTPLLAMQNISVINGKASLGVHAISSRLTAAGYTYREIANQVAVSDYVILKPDEAGSRITERYYKQLVEQGFPIHLCYMYGDKATMTKLKKDAFEAHPDKMIVGILPTPVDYYTAIEFTKVKNGEVHTHIEYLYKSDLSVGILEKDNWVNNFRVMLRTRCLVFGARFFAPEAIAGMYDITEMLESKNVRFTVNETGEVDRIIDPGELGAEDVLITSESN